MQYANRSHVFALLALSSLLGVDAHAQTTAGAATSSTIKIPALQLPPSTSPAAALDLSPPKLKLWDRKPGQVRRMAVAQPCAQQDQRLGIRTKTGAIVTGCVMDTRHIDRNQAVINSFRATGYGH